MHHKRIGSALVTILAVSACASSPRVETASGESATPTTAAPVNARTLPAGVTMNLAATQTAALVLDFDNLTFNGRRYPFAANVTATNLQKQGGALR